MRQANRWVLAATVLAVAGLCVGHASARDFYVSSVNAARNDSNAGTSSSAPWATFDKIKQAWGSTIVAGDTVHLEKGSRWTWSGQVYFKITQGGSAQAGAITIRGDDYGAGASPVLAKTGGADDGPAIWIAGAAKYITLRGFVVDGGSAAGLASTGVYVGGPEHTGLISNIQILDMTFQNLGNSSTLYIVGVDFSPWNNCSITDCLIQGNDISGYTAHGINHYGQRFSYKTTNFLQRITWRGNRVHDPSSQRTSGLGGAGIHIATGGRDNVFENNYVIGPNEMGSFHVERGCNDEDGLVLRNNVMRDNAIAEGVLIYNDGAFGSQGSLLNITISGNIIAGTQNSAICLQGQNCFYGAVDIHNNTLYHNWLNTWGQPWNGGEIFAYGNNDRVALNIHNNIMIHKPNGSGDTTACLVIKDGYAGPVTHGRNVYWSLSGASGMAVYDRGNTYTVASVKSFESTGKNQDPLLVDLSAIPTTATGLDGTTCGFALQSGSPCIDAGTTLGTPAAVAINGLARPQNAAWDLGAFERPVNAPAPAPPTNLRKVGP